MNKEKYDQKKVKTIGRMQIVKEHLLLQSVLCTGYLIFLPYRMRKFNYPGCINKAATT